MKQPSSSLQNMSIWYLYPCSCTAPSFVRLLRRPFFPGMVHEAVLRRITRLCDLCPTACPEQRKFSGRNGGRPSGCEPDELPDRPPCAIGEKFVAGQHADT